MYYAEFYHDTAGTQPACGDRSVLILDGRESLHSQAKYAQDWCNRHKFKSFCIKKGESFTRSHVVSPVQSFEVQQNA